MADHETEKRDDPVLYSGPNGPTRDLRSAHEATEIIRAHFGQSSKVVYKQGVSQEDDKKAQALLSSWADVTEFSKELLDNISKWTGSYPDTIQMFEDLNIDPTPRYHNYGGKHGYDLNLFQFNPPIIEGAASPRMSSFLQEWQEPGYFMDTELDLSDQFAHADDQQPQHGKQIKNRDLRINFHETIKPSTPLYGPRIDSLPETSSITVSPDFAKSVAAQTGFSKPSDAVEPLEPSPRMKDHHPDRVSPLVG